VKSLTDRVDQLFAEWNKPDSPGCAIGIIKGSEMIYKSGYGLASLEHNIPISSKTVFYIASTSKQFTAMSILLLADQGRISLDDAIQNYLPEFPEYNNYITIRHLIYHTSGIRDYLQLMGLAGMNVSNIYTNEDIIELLARQKYLNFEPGDDFLYNNSGYFLLSMIVKRASGQSLREFAEENIFEPLGMKNTRFCDDRTMIVRNRATGHFSKEDGGLRVYMTNFDKVGSGGVMSNVEDLFLWDQNFYENKLGKSDTINELLTVGTLNSGKRVKYAFGLKVGKYRGLNTIHHEGSSFGFGAEMLRFLEKNFSVICLANMSNINTLRLAKQIADIYLADQFKLLDIPPKSQDIPREPMSLPIHRLKEFLGHYHSNELQVTYKLVLKEGNLFFSHKNPPREHLEPSGNDKFQVSNIDEFIRYIYIDFIRDEQNKVAGFVLNTPGVKNLHFVRIN